MVKTRVVGKCAGNTEADCAVDAAGSVMPTPSYSPLAKVRTGRSNREEFSVKDHGDADPAHPAHPAVFIDSSFVLQNSFFQLSCL